MSDDFSSKTETFLDRWVPLAGEGGTAGQSQDETPEQVRQRLELFMEKVESQAQEQLGKRKPLSVGSTFRWQFTFARLRHPVAVTAAMMSIFAALFLVMTKTSQHELHQSINVSFPANNTLKEAESAIELLRTGSVELGEKTDPSRVERTNAAIRQKQDRIEPNKEQLPSNVRGQLTEMVLVYNDSLAQWKRNKSAEASQAAAAQISPVNTADFAKVAKIYRVIQEESPASAEVLKNSSIVGIDTNKVTWSTSIPAESWDEASLWNAANKTSTTLSIRDQQGSYQKEFVPTKTASGPNR